MTEQRLGETLRGLVAGWLVGRGVGRRFGWPESGEAEGRLEAEGARAGAREHSGIGEEPPNRPASTRFGRV